MNWSSIFGLPSSREKNVPILNALEQQRLKQIESLRTFHPSVTELRKDTEYKISIVIKDKPLDLHVYLPSNFPNEIPIVSVAPAVKHPWVNDQMVIIGCDSLNKFYMHSNLGRSLQDVCKQFVENPPSFCPTSNSSVSYSEAMASSAFSETLLNIEDKKDVSNSPMVSWAHPEGFSKVAGQLELCSVEELEELEMNPEKLMQLIFDDDLIRSSKEKRDDQMAKIEDIARKNLAKRPVLEAARERLLAKYEELSNLRVKFDHWSQIQNDQFEMRTTQQIHTALQVGVAEMEEESENIAEEFLNENIQIEQFMKKFIEKRKLTHMLRWKEENVLQL